MIPPGVLEELGRRALVLAIILDAEVEAVTGQPVDPTHVLIINNLFHVGRCQFPADVGKSLTEHPVAAVRMGYRSDEFFGHLFRHLVNLVNPRHVEWFEGLEGAGRHAGRSEEPLLAIQMPRQHHSVVGTPLGQLAKEPLIQ